MALVLGLFVLGRRRAYEAYEDTSPVFKIVLCRAWYRLFILDGKLGSSRAQGTRHVT